MKAIVININPEKNTVSLRVAVATGRFIKETNYWARVTDASGFTKGEELELTADEALALNEIVARD